MEFAKIEAFIRKHHVMTVATVGVAGAACGVPEVSLPAAEAGSEQGDLSSPGFNPTPWVAHVFYAWSR
jgi:hypothetical protein